MKKEEEEEEEKGRRERARVRRQREEEWRERRGEEARQRVIELENQSTRVASRRARCLTALDPRSRVLEFIVLEELTSPLMLATLLALPRSGSNRYTLRRRGRGGRNIFRNIQEEAVGGDGDFLGFCCRPLSASFQEPRNTGGTSFHFYYTVSPARPVSFFFVVYTLSQFLGGGIPLESRIKGRSANWITITVGETAEKRSYN